MYIVYKCKACRKHFILLVDEVRHNEEESKYITCPYFGRHKNIIVCGRFDDLKEAMNHGAWKREKGSIRQIR